MGACCLFFVFILAYLIPQFFGQQLQHVTLVVDGETTIADTDPHFICATLDWWPHNKCDYDQCPWGYSSILNMDLSRPLLVKAIKAFKQLRIRIGGSLQDQVVYDVGGNSKSGCHPFRKIQNGLFGFSKGCLSMKRWDELNRLFSTTGALVTFSLNALNGRHKLNKSGIAWEGPWDSTNARAFINYTVAKGYEIDSWEFGNELGGKGIGASISAEIYARDVINLKKIIDDLYKKFVFKPSIVAPGGIFDRQWYTKFLQLSGVHAVNAISHHVYNLGPGNDPHLISKILDPNHLNNVLDTFSIVRATMDHQRPYIAVWVGESGGAYNSGGRHVSNTFVNSLWYVDQLGMASRFETKVYCRQTLVGGHYGLLNTTTLVPNPDYYSAFLWNRLMGKGVLTVTDAANSPYLRAYAHCTRGRTGIALVLINLSSKTKFLISLQNSKTMTLNIHAQMSPKMSISRSQKKAGERELKREEYHLTPKNGYLQSQTVLLNGIPLQLTKEGDIPRLEPLHKNHTSPIYVTPLSIAFIVIPNFDAPICARPFDIFNFN
ncbi:glucuronidase 2 [Euphorbia peplus]|nr:glucuronidase 2 [Euphorbia peplus]